MQRQYLSRTFTIRWVISLLVAFGFPAWSYAQDSITGPACVVVGTEYTYTIAGDWNSGTAMTWTVTNGTITGSSSGTPLPQVHVIWNTISAGTLQVSCSYPTGSASLTVTPTAGLTGGIIVDHYQIISYNTIPDSLQCSAAAGDTCSVPNYEYQWQSGPDSTAFTNITGATGLNLSFITGLTSTTWYRRMVTETVSGNIAYSNTALVIVDPPLVLSAISSPSTTINYGRSPGQLTLTNYSGGNGTYAFQWETSTDNASWAGIPWATASSYSPPAMESNAYFRVVVQSGPTITASASVLISVGPEVFPGIIGPSNVSILTGTSPGLLSGNPASGGACSGSFSYQWQSSNNGSAWASISGATGLTLSPVNLSATTYYRLQVACSIDTEYSNISTVEIVAASDLNYVRIREIHKAGVTDSLTAAGLTSPYDVTQTTRYFDGLGRVTQTVAMQQTPSGKDLVTMSDYDSHGREIHKFLPFSDTSASGNYKYSGPADQYTFNSSEYPNEQYYYSLVSMEPSPLDRPLTAYPQGGSWVGANRGVSSQALVNQISDSVRLWTIAYPPGSIPTTTTTYAPGTLYMNVTTDEAGHQVVTYTDFDRQVILKKVQQSGSPGTAHVGWLCTYYVYDDLGLLRFVIQPQAVVLINGSWSISATVASQLCFRYEYDQWGRMNIKKIPGAGEVHMVYDERDRLVMSQDSNMRASEKWLVTNYDVENRPDSTGLITDPTHYNNLSWHTAAAMATTPYPAVSGYTYTPLTQTHYDDYAWVTAAHNGYLTTTMDTSYDANTTFFIQTSNASPVYSVHQTPFMIARGMVTGTTQYLLGTTTPQYDVNFYDDRARVLEVQDINYTGGYDKSINQYSFSGTLLRNLLVTVKAGINPQTYLQNERFSYDAAFRPTGVIIEYIDGYNFTVDTMEYDELGRLRAKYLGGHLDSLVYSYNIRSWTTGINLNYIAGTTSDYFGEELAYDKQTSVSTTTYSAAQYNGNITGLIWKSAGDGTGRKYDFTYDTLNRLTGAAFLQNPGGSTWNTAAMDYTVDSLSYDANGNIQTMNQHGFKVGAPAGLIDNLTYTYQTTSNQLSQVIDGANDTASTLGDFHYKTKGSYDYTYDGNGNLKIDNNKGIDSIGYNYLNLPQYIHINGKGTITYAYDATGLKEAKIVVDSTVSPVRTTTTKYIKNFQYSNDTLEQASLPEGRARWQKQFFLNGDSAYHFFYDYFLKDHLGDTRVILTGEKDTAQYMATMEAAYRTKENELFYNIDSTSYPTASVPGGYPTDNTTNPNDSVAMVDGSPGNHTQGPAIILKVMTGDSISIGVKSYYLSGGTAGSNSSSLNSVLNTLAGGLVALGGGGGHGTLPTLDNSSGSPVYNALNTYFYPTYDSTPASRPKAYLNWMLLDNQFNYVSGNNQSGAIPVGSPNILNPLATTIKLKHSGYLYIWVSNETQNWMVFFDNLSIEDFSGPMLEETHFYPFGLTMAGISDKALKANYAENKYRFQKQELQSKEFSDGSGLEMYEFKYRFDDCQLGRFWQIDPLASKYEYNSPYAFSENQVTTHIELEGLEKFPINEDNPSSGNPNSSIARSAKNQQAVESQRAAGRAAAGATTATTPALNIGKVTPSAAASDKTSFGLNSTAASGASSSGGLHLPTFAQGMIWSTGTGEDAPGSPPDPTKPIMSLFFDDDVQTTMDAATQDAQGKPTEDPLQHANDMNKAANTEPNTDGLQRFQSRLGDSHTDGGYVRSINGLSDGKGIYTLDLDSRDQAHDTVRYNDKTQKFDTTLTKP